MLPLAEQSRALTPQLSARSMYNRCDSALKFPQRNATPVIALSPHWEKQIANADFLLFFGYGRRAHWIAAVVRKWERTDWKNVHIANGRHPPVQTGARGRACQGNGFQFRGRVRAVKKKIGEDRRDAT